MLKVFDNSRIIRSLFIFVFILFINSGLYARISCVRGFVTDPNGAPVDNCDLDFDNVFTGERLYTPGDNTDPSGFYTVCVPNGTYNISYGPPPGTHLLGYRLFNQVLSGNTQIDVSLDFGKVISGTATDSATGLPIGRVNLNVDDLATGHRVYTPNDKSDSLTGDYWVVVPQGNYRLRYKSPVGSRWLSRQMEPVSVFADTIINVVLAQGMLLSGNVRDGFGAGIENISIDLRDMATGEKIYLANNGTDSTGFYNAAVPSGLFQLRYVPLPGDRHIGVAVDSVLIESDMARDQILDSGWLVSALVHDSTGNPLEAADLDVIQISTAEKLYTPNDKTDSLGLSTIVLRPDLYTIRVQPPPGSIFDRVVLDSVSISSDTSFDVTLPEVPKVNIAGRVIDFAGDGLGDIEINFADTVAGSRIYLVDNITDSTGIYNFMAPVGSFAIEISPPRGSHNVGLALGDVTISQDTIWSDIVLQNGYIVSAAVVDPQGMPVEGVDFDFITQSGIVVFTPHDNTDIEGGADITVLPGLYTIEITPPAGSSFENKLIAGLNIDADTSMTIFLVESGYLPAIPFVLNANYPNPFNQGTTISYVLFMETEVSLAIYNSLGQRVTLIEMGNQSPGYYTSGWDGIDARGRSVASGLYFYQLKTSTGSSTHNMLLVR